MSDPTEAASPRPLSESDPNGGGPDGFAGDMGVTSERTGRVRGTPGEVTHGTEDTAKTDEIDAIAEADDSEPSAP